MDASINPPLSNPQEATTGPQHDVSRFDFMALYHIGQTEFENLPNYLQDILYTINDDVDNGKWLELNDAINIINGSSLSWLRIGAVAQVVKELKRYKGKFKSFTDFCQKGLNRSRNYIDRIIKASKTVLKLACLGFTDLPTNESQARLLTKYKGEELGSKWQEVLSSTPGHMINAKSIEKIIEPIDENAHKAIKITGTAWDNFKRKAHEAGLNPEEELEKLLGTWEPQEEPQEVPELEDEEIEALRIEREKRWQEDLEHLIATYDVELLQRLYNSE